MAQASPNTKFSKIPPADLADIELGCGIALGLFAEALRELQDMSNEAREEAMKQLTAWMITDRFGPYARPAIQGLQKYCLAECLIEDPAWEVPHFAERFSREAKSERPA